MRLVLIFLCFSFNLFAQVHQVEVTDPASEMMAIQEAEKIVLKQLLTQKGLEAEDYLKKLTTRFFTRYENYKEKRLRQTYGANYQTTLTPEQKETVEKKFDSETAGYYKRFLSLDSVFKSKLKEKLPENKWTIEVSQIPSGFELWFKRFEAANNQVKFLLIPHIDLQGLEWSDLKLSGERPFVDALWAAWEKWSLEESAGINLSLCVDQCERQWMSDKSADSNDLGVYFGQEDEVLLVADLRLELKKIKTLPNGEVEFKLEGSYSLHDYASRSLMEAMNLGPQTKRIQWSTEAQTINSQLANHFYRLGVPALARLRSFHDFKPYNQSLQLVIDGQKNLLEIRDLEQQLKLITGAFSPRWELFALTRTTVEYRVLYRGEEKSFKELITSPSQLKSSYNAQCVWDTSSKEVRLKLVHE